MSVATADIDAVCRDRNPGADVRVGVAEDLPFEDDAFDRVLAAHLRDAGSVRLARADDVEDYKDFAATTGTGGR